MLLIALCLSINKKTKVINISRAYNEHEGIKQKYGMWVLVLLAPFFKGRKKITVEI